MSLSLPIAEISLDLFLLLAMGLTVGVLAGLFGIGVDLSRRTARRAVWRAPR